MPTGPPLNVNGTVLSPTSINVSWNGPGCQYQGGQIRHYILQLNDTVGERIVSGTFHIVQNLLPDHVYAYRVTAFTVDLGPYSHWRYVTTDDNDTLIFRNVSSTSTSVYLEWEPPESGQDLALSYTIQCTDTNTGRRLSQIVTTETAVNITQLQPHHTFMCNLTVFKPDGSISNTTNVTTKEAGKL